MGDNLNVLARRIGADMVGMMGQLIGLPRDDHACCIYEFKTVDGHCFTATITYDGFEGPDTLEERND